MAERREPSSHGPRACPSCGADVAGAGWICPECDHIIDPSVLEGPGRRARPRPATAARAAWDGSAVADAMILGDVTISPEDFDVVPGASDEEGAPNTLLFYTSGSTSRVLSPDAVPEALPGRGRNIRKTPYEDFLLSCIDGARTVREILALSGLAPEEVTVTLLTLLDKGVIRVRAHTREPEPAPARRKPLDRDATQFDPSLPGAATGALPVVPTDLLGGEDEVTEFGAAPRSPLSIPPAETLAASAPEMAPPPLPAVRARRSPTRVPPAVDPSPSGGGTSSGGRKGKKRKRGRSSRRGQTAAPREIIAPSVQREQSRAAPEAPPPLPARTPEPIPAPSTRSRIPEPTSPPPPSARSRTIEPSEASRRPVAPPPLAPSMRPVVSEDTPLLERSPPPPAAPSVLPPLRRNVTPSVTDSAPAARDDTPPPAAPGPSEPPVPPAHTAAPTRGPRRAAPEPPEPRGPQSLARGPEPRPDAPGVDTADLPPPPGVRADTPPPRRRASTPARTAPARSRLPTDAPTPPPRPRPALELEERAPTPPPRRSEPSRAATPPPALAPSRSEPARAPTPTPPPRRPRATPERDESVVRPPAARRMIPEDLFDDALADDVFDSGTPPPPLGLADPDADALEADLSALLRSDASPAPERAPSGLVPAPARVISPSALTPPSNTEARRIDDAVAAALSDLDADRPAGLAPPSSGPAFAQEPSAELELQSALDAVADPSFGRAPPPRLASAFLQIHEPGVPTPSRAGGPNGRAPRTPPPRLDSQFIQINEPGMPAMPSPEPARPPPPADPRPEPRAEPVRPPPARAARPSPPVEEPRVPAARLEPAAEPKPESRRARPVPGEGVEVDGVRMAKAERLFNAALKDKAEGNLVSARMNMKLALTFDPSNPLYLQAFEELSRGGGSGGGPSGMAAARGFYDAASQAEQEGRVDDAIDLLQKALKEAKEPAFYNRLGVLLAMKKGEFVRAQKLIETAISLSRGNPTYEHNLRKILQMAASRDVESRKVSGSKRRGLLGFLGRKR
jgi:hypothetical protein